MHTSATTPTLLFAFSPQSDDNNGTPWENAQAVSFVVVAVVDIIFSFGGWTGQEPIDCVGTASLDVLMQLGVCILFFDQCVSLRSMDQVEMLVAQTEPFFFFFFFFC